MEYFDSDDDSFDVSSEEDDKNKDPDFEFSSASKKKARRLKPPSGTKVVGVLPKPAQNEVVISYTDKESQHVCTKCGKMFDTKKDQPCHHCIVNTGRIDINKSSQLNQSNTNVPITVLDALKSRIQDRYFENILNNTVSKSLEEPRVKQVPLNRNYKVSTMPYISKQCKLCGKKFSSIYDLKVHKLRANCQSPNKSVPPIKSSSSQSMTTNVISSTIDSTTIGSTSTAPMRTSVTSGVMQNTIPRTVGPHPPIIQTVIPLNFIINTVSYTDPVSIGDVNTEKGTCEANTDKIHVVRKKRANNRRESDDVIIMNVENDDVRTVNQPSDIIPKTLIYVGNVQNMKSDPKMGSSAGLNRSSQSRDPHVIPMVLSSKVNGASSERNARFMADYRNEETKLVCGDSSDDDVICLSDPDNITISEKRDVNLHSRYISNISDEDVVCISDSMT